MTDYMTRIMRVQGRLSPVLGPPERRSGVKCEWRFQGTSGAGFYPHGGACANAPAGHFGDIDGTLGVGDGGDSW